MFRRFSFPPLAFSLLILLPAPFFALLCRGHSPSRFDTINLPVWERRPPSPAPPCHLFRLTPAPPGAIQTPGNLWQAALLQTDENRLLATAEHPGTGDAGQAGAWLEAACAWGRTAPDLSDKQDRVAIRLMAAQSDDGTFGRKKTTEPWTHEQIEAQQACLRGLLAYYAVTRRPAAIYAAQMAGDEIVPLLPSLSDSGWAFSLTRLAQETDDPRFLTAAEQQSAGSDGLGLCALYEATGKSAYLSAARLAWAQSKPSPALAAELLLLTGRPGYAAALNRLPASGPELARAGWTRVPHGVAITTVHASMAVFGNVRWNQRIAGKARTISVTTAKPAAFALRLYLPPGQASQVEINGLRQTVPALPGSYATLARRWKNGDVVTIRDLPTPAASRHPSLEGKG